MARVHPRLFQATGGATEKSGKSAAEKVVCTLSNVVTTPENPAIQLDANVPITTGGGGTEQTVRIRRESITGTEVAKVVVKLGASAKNTVGIQVEDNPGETAQSTYVITVAEAAAEEDTVVSPTLQATY